MAKTGPVASSCTERGSTTPSRDQRCTQAGVPLSQESVSDGGRTPCLDHRRASSESTSRRKTASDLASFCQG